MNKRMISAVLAAARAFALATPASALVTLTTANGTAIYSGPTPTFDFEIALPTVYASANLVTGSDGTRAQPLGSTGQYLSVGPTEGTPVVINLSSFGSISSLSFLWGSVDDYNLLEVLDGSNNVMASFTGVDALGLGGTLGNQTSPLSNRLATLTFTGADQQLFTSLRLTSNTNAFEVDNFAIAAVPEPATWGMMIAGFALIGGMVRRRRRATDAQPAMS